jgi:ABC-type bacteriocin/lantibiotic exporter with double-glycine peptidase domain
MFWYDPRIAAMSIGIGSLHAFVGALVYGRRSGANRRLQYAKTVGGSFSAEDLERIESLKISGGISEAFSAVTGRQARALSAEQEFGRVLGLTETVPALLSYLSTLSVLALGAVRVMHGRLTVGAVVALYSLSAVLMVRLAELLAHAGQFRELREKLIRIEDARAIEPEIATPEPVVRTGAECATIRLSGKLEVLDITFGYSRLKPPVIRAVRFELAAGAQLGIVGRPGSGKSTLARLICGVDKPWSGEVLLAGHPIRSIAKPVLTRSVALLERSAFLFGGTVEDNVRLWNDSLPPEALREALEDACLDDVIKARRGGYRHRVAPGGTNFSGGQRQRLEIARALARYPTLLVLDEATDALDPDLEAAIRRNLRRRGCACIIISLRPSTIRCCDKVLVLDGGSITST